MGKVYMVVRWPGGEAMSEKFWRVVVVVVDEWGWCVDDDDEIR